MSPTNAQPPPEVTHFTATEERTDVWRSLPRHDPHDREVEHAAQAADPLAGRVAAMPSIFALIGVLHGLLADVTQNEALHFRS